MQEPDGKQQAENQATKRNDHARGRGRRNKQQSDHQSRHLVELFNYCPHIAISDQANPAHLKPTTATIHHPLNDFFNPPIFLASRIKHTLPPLHHILQIQAILHSRPLPNPDPRTPMQLILSLLPKQPATNPLKAPLNSTPPTTSFPITILLRIPRIRRRHPLQLMTRLLDRVRPAHIRLRIWCRHSLQLTPKPIVGGVILVRSGIRRSPTDTCRSCASTTGIGASCAA